MKTAEDYVAQAEECLRRCAGMHGLPAGDTWTAQAQVYATLADVAQNAEALAFGREAQQQMVDSLAAAAGEIEEHPRYPRGIVP